MIQIKAGRLRLTQFWLPIVLSTPKSHGVSGGRPAKTALEQHVRLGAMIGLIAIIGTGGCQSLGPGSISHDRLDYGSAMADSWKHQMLLNIVKFRYFNPPVFLNISSMIASYQIEGQANIGSSVLPHSTASSSTRVGSTYLTVGAGASYVEHPTITYAPLTGAKCVEALLKPIPPQTIVAMIEAGHPADFILKVSVDAINGLHNRSAAPERGRLAAPAFDRVAQALRHIQQAGALGTRFARLDGQKEIF